MAIDSAIRNAAAVAAAAKDGAAAAKDHGAAAAKDGAAAAAAAASGANAEDKRSQSTLRGFIKTGKWAVLDPGIVFLCIW